MGIKKYYGEPPLKETRPFTSQFAGEYDEFDAEFMEDLKPQVFPSPEKLAYYEEISKGAAKEILDLVKKEQSQRHSWENAVLVNNKKNIFLGQFLIFMLLICTASVSIALAFNHFQILGFGLALVVYTKLAFSLKREVAIKPEAKPKKNYSTPRNRRKR
jgi:uncharacterized membrane protein